MKNDPIESALAGLDTHQDKAEFSKALAAKSNLVVAKAARLVGNAQWSDLNDELASAFDRFLGKNDKACAAVIAIARALTGLDYDGPQLFLRGMRHVQMEGSFGPPIDVAAELREVCAMGLANCSYPHKLRELLPLLIDKEWRVRAGAVRAIGVVGTDGASLLLRYKMLIGDADAEVMSDCFAAVLNLEGSEGVTLVAGFASTGRPEVREAAILALGASRRADAIDWLIADFDKTADPAMRRCILLSLSTSRIDAAIAFLLGTIRDGSTKASSQAAEALLMHSRDEQLRAQVEEALRLR